MSRYLVMSDPHFPPDHKVSNFTGEQLFNRCLGWGLRKFDHVFIDGDLDELWQSAERMTEQQRLEAIERRYTGLMKTIKGNPKITVIAGNHDWLLHRIYGHPEKVVIEENGWKAIIIHGHQWDTFNKNANAVIGKTITTFWGGLETIVGAGKAHAVESGVLNWVQRQRYKSKKLASVLPDASSYVDEAVEYAKQQRANAIVIGHTHKEKVLHRDGVWFGDAGSWCNGNSTYVIIDTDRKSISLGIFA